MHLKITGIEKIPEGDLKATDGGNYGRGEGGSTCQAYKRHKGMREEERA